MKLLWLLILGFLITNPGITQQLSTSLFIPDDVFEQFNQLPKDYKTKRKVLKQTE